MDVLLETDRLILRRFTMDDIDALAELDSDPAVMQYVSGGNATDRDEIETDYLPHFLSYYARYERFGFWAAIERATGDFLGWFHFRPHSEEAPNEPELGYRLRQAAWGNGYGTEGSLALIEMGFERLDIERVTATAFADNQASRRIMEKVGMRLVRSYKMMPDELFAELGVTDPTLFEGGAVEYAITRSEWESRRR